MKWKVDKNLNLQNGGHYSTRVAAVNRADLASVHHTDGVIVDSSLPKVGYDTIRFIVCLKSYSIYHIDLIDISNLRPILLY